MTVKAKLDGEFVVSISQGHGAIGLQVPPALSNRAPHELRFDGSSIVAREDLEAWLIDEDGRKRVPEINAGENWQAIECDFDASLIKDSDAWRVETDADRLAAAKAKARAAIIARADAFTAPIMSAYPEAERSGWDKREAEARSIIAASDKAAAIEATVIIKSLAQAAGDDEAATIARSEKIVAKADQFAAISAAVEVMRDQSLDAIEAVTDIADMPATLAALAEQATALAARYGLA